jgi:hypothetical protein
MGTIIAIIVVLLLMTVVIFFILKNTVSNINEQGRVYFTLKLQQYEKEFEGKHANDNERNKGLEEQRTNNVKSVSQIARSGSLVYVDEKLDYQVSDLLKLVKKIEKGFIVDNEAVIQAFIKEKVETDNFKKYDKLKKVKDYIMSLGVYQILTTNEENFIENVEREIEKIDHKIYHRYIMTADEFEIEDFLNYVENEMGTCDPTIYVIVGGEDENYDKLDDRIKTIFDDRVYKGIKIIYKNKLYDYSLS